jgi:hypothetical protein
MSPLENHIEVIKKEMSELEKQLCETETLTLEQITTISSQMQFLQGHLYFLVSVKNIVDPQKIQPVQRGLTGKLSRL